jgi:hypothetical protein
VALFLYAFKVTNWILLALKYYTQTYHEKKPNQLDNISDHKVAFLGKLWHFCLAAHY